MAGSKDRSGSQATECGPSGSQKGQGAEVFLEPPEGAQPRDPQSLAQ